MNKTAKLLIFSFLLFMGGLLISSLIKEKIEDKEIYNAVIEEYNQMCLYVKENEEHYKTISQYETDKLSDELHSFLVERYGEYQNSRNIVFFNCHDVRALYNGTTNKEEIIYYITPDPSYHIQIVYSDNLFLNAQDSENQCVINSDICVFLFTSSGWY